MGKSHNVSVHVNDAVAGCVCVLQSVFADYYGTVKRAWNCYSVPD